MNGLKKFKKRFSETFNKYINGTKGMISLFLAMIMLPFMSVALLITESVRYQDAVEAIDEVLDCVGLSTLAEYDPYLENRFGILAMKQKQATKDRYQYFLDKNKGAIANNFTLGSSNAQGVYPFSENDILLAQVLEASEMVPAIDTLADLTNLDDLHKKILGMLHIDKLNGILDIVQKSSDAAGATSELYDTVKTFAELFNSYRTAKNEYIKACNELFKQTDKLVDKYDEVYQNKDKEEDVYSDWGVKGEISSCNKKRDAVVQKANALITSMNGVKTRIINFKNKAEEVGESIDKAGQSVDSSLGNIQEATKGTGNFIIDVYTKIIGIVDSNVGSDIGMKVDNETAQLRTHISRLKKVVFGQTPENPNSNYFYVDASFGSVDIEKERIRNYLVPPVLRAIPENTGDLILEALDDMKEEKDLLSGIKDLDFIKKLLGIVDKIKNTSLLYDGRLNANVSRDKFYSVDSSSGLSSNDKYIINAVSGLVSSANDLLDSVKELNIFKALDSIKEFLSSVKDFICYVITWVTTTISDIGSLFADKDQLLDKVLLTSYCASLLPSRRTFESGSSVYGYPYKKIFTMNGGVDDNQGIGGTFANLQTIMEGAEYGSDPGFKGAELEYMLVGGPNEIMNQTATFFNLFMTRLVFDMFAILMNQDVARMAVSANVAGWVVYIALILAEPLVDMFLLVNGESVCLIKKSVYLTPVGLPTLVEKAGSITGLGDIIDGLRTEGNAEFEGMLPMDYQKYIMFMMLLKLDKNKFADRLQNIISIESKQYYKDELTFDLSNANTCVKADVKGKLNSMFDLNALTQGGPFEVHRVRYIGY